MKTTLREKHFKTYTESGKMPLWVYLKRRLTNAFQSGNDPTEDAKGMVTFIQRLVGIHDVFGDNNSSPSMLSILSTLVLCGTFIYVGTLSQLVYLWQVLPDKVETFKAINCVSAASVPLSKYFFMWSAKKRLKTIFGMCRYGFSSIPEGSEARNKMVSTLNRARYASWVVVLNQTFTHVIYLLVPFLFTVFGNDRYLPTTPGETYGLSPKYETPYFEATFVITCFATAFSVINQTGYIILFITLLGHELGHFYAITVTLENIQDILNGAEKQRDVTQNVDESQKKVSEKLKFCIKHHQFLMQYHSKIRELYRVIFGAHFLMMTIVLVTTLQTMTAWDVRNTILTAVTGTMPLFLYCFGGEMLITAGLDMSAAMYSCGWELMDIRQAKLILLMLSLSQRPLYLTAADVFIMNRETFGNVAQVVYKMYAVFN